MRMHELPEASALLRLIQAQNTAAAGGKPASQPQRAKPDTSTPQAAASSGGNARKTAMDDGSMRRILGASDLYQVLDVPRSASSGVIKKAYRKVSCNHCSPHNSLSCVFSQLALKYHPDKNQAPGAEDVFKSASLEFLGETLNASLCLQRLDTLSQYSVMQKRRIFTTRLVMMARPAHSLSLVTAAFTVEVACTIRRS